VDEVVPRGLASGDAKANDGRLAGGDAARDFVFGERVAAAIVLEGVFARCGLFATLVELGRRAKTPVGVA
jgi:hypothetical protein